MPTDTGSGTRTQRRHTPRTRAKIVDLFRLAITGSLVAILAGALSTGAVAGYAMNEETQLSGPNLEDDVPQISELRIQVLPEFDDPRVLVIVQGRLDTSEALLPVEVTLPIPRGAQVNQMATMNTSTGNIESQPFDAVPDPESEQWTLVTYELNSAHFFYEYYYAPFTTANRERNFTYSFRTPYAVAGLEVEIQEPLGATDFSLSPPATLAQYEENLGFTYHLYEIGALDTAGVIDINIAYHKDTDAPSLTREELMRLQMADSAGLPTEQVGMSAAEEPWQALWIGLGMVGLLGAGAAGWAWIRGGAPTRRPAGPRAATRAEAARPRRANRAGTGSRKDRDAMTSSANYCAACGAKLRQAAHFCHVCGSRTGD